MPNHSEAEKARIRDLTLRYLPSNLVRMEARRDCPYASLHLQQASYGQKNFANIGIVYEFVSVGTFIRRHIAERIASRQCRADTSCTFHGSPLPLQMSAESRINLLSELETLDPPPYHDPANIALCRSVRDRILVTRDVTVGSVYEFPVTPTRPRLSHLALQSLARSAPPSRSLTQRLRGPPQTIRAWAA